MPLLIAIVLVVLILVAIVWDFRRGMKSWNWRVRKRAIELIKDEVQLTKIAIHDRNKSVRDIAEYMVEDQSLLSQIIQNSPNWRGEYLFFEWKERRLNRITDHKLLSDIALNPNLHWTLRNAVADRLPPNSKVRVRCLGDYSLIDESRSQGSITIRSINGVLLSDHILIKTSGTYDSEKSMTLIPGDWVLKISYSNTNETPYPWKYGTYKIAKSTADVDVHLHAIAGRRYGIKGIIKEKENFVIKDKIFEAKVIDEGPIEK